ncbi:unnamed protein product, partial [Mycena citricolor]
MSTLELRPRSSKLGCRSRAVAAAAPSKRSRSTLLLFSPRLATSPTEPSTSVTTAITRLHPRGGPTGYPPAGPAGGIW